jgi:hypothetical protein
MFEERGFRMLPQIAEKRREVVKKICKENIALGIEMTNYNFLPICGTCVKRKLSKVPFPKE